MNSHFPGRVGTAVLWLLISLYQVSAKEQPLSQEHQEQFEQAATVLKENCLKCHSGESPKGQLNLTTRAGILKGGELGGSGYNAEEPLQSGILLAVKYEGLEMPPTGQMSEDRIDILAKWLESGLPWPADVKVLEYEAEAGPPPVNETTKQFWSFQRVKEPTVPSGDFSGFLRNPIDAFVGHHLQANGLTPSPPADARTLVRRMYYDLLGLAPTPAEADTWTEKISAPDGNIRQDAVHELIETLLESPHYGEQWGRHWLDLVRYAETNSYERDGSKPYVWRYRDYVIQSFNDDKPYDQFVTEQLAGDEIPQATAHSIIATGFYRLGRWDDEPADPKLAFYDDLDDIVLTTCQTFLGLTVNCARCHDHKIDPIPQADYYRLLAFFHNVRRYGVRSDDSVVAASVREVNLSELEEETAKQQSEYETKLNETQKRLAAIEDLIKDDLSDVEKEDFVYTENRLALIRKRVGSLIREEQAAQYEQLMNQLRKLDDNRPSGLARVLCVTEDVANVQPVHVLLRGSPHAHGAEVTPGFPSVLSPPEVTIQEIPAGAESSGRRTVLADWITNPENPLTARVMVNRIWQYHFGRGIVRSSSDFGFQGTAPTHPQLLDWLASQFVKSGWSIKAMHRLMMTSGTYQMSSSARSDAWEKDPTNDLYWRFDMRRLAAEEVRDSILQAAGQLNTGKLFGPSIYTQIPDEVKAGQSRPGAGWGKSSPEDEARRSIYIHVKRSLVDPLLERFDGADTDQTCPVRFVTTQPTQALGMLNSDFIRTQARHLAEVVKHEAPNSAEDQIRLTLKRVTQRHPSDRELQQGLTLMNDLVHSDRMTSDEALQYFCLVALNLNEFVYLD